MKCPKCGYISFDFNQVCPKCSKDVGPQRESLNLPNFRPSPPALLGALTGEAEDSSIGLGMGGGGGGTGAAEFSPEDSQTIEAMQEAFQDSQSLDMQIEATPEPGVHFPEDQGAEDLSSDIQDLLIDDAELGPAEVEEEAVSLELDDLGGDETEIALDEDILGGDADEDLSLEPDALEPDAGGDLILEDDLQISLEDAGEEQEELVIEDELSFDEDALSKPGDDIAEPNALESLELDDDTASYEKDVTAGEETEIAFDAVDDDAEPALDLDDLELTQKVPDAQGDDEATVVDLEDLDLDLDLDETGDKS